MRYTECSINYHRMKIYDRGLFAGGVLNTYYKHTAVFTSPPLTKAEFEELDKAYTKTYAAYRNGGKAQEGAFLIAKAKLIAALDEIGKNVNEVAKGDEAIILEGGFKPVKTFRSVKNEPPVPEIEKLERGGDGQLLTQCKNLSLDVFYGCILCEGAPLPDDFKLQDGKLIIPVGLQVPIQIDETKGRKKSFVNLKSTIRYYVYFFARNSAGVSSLSEARSIVCG